MQEGFASKFLTWFTFRLWTNAIYLFAWAFALGCLIFADAIWQHSCSDRIPLKIKPSQEFPLEIRSSNEFSLVVIEFHAPCINANQCLCIHNLLNQMPLRLTIRAVKMAYNPRANPAHHRFRSGWVERKL